MFFFILQQYSNIKKSEKDGTKISVVTSRILNAAIDRARQALKLDALKKVVKDKTNQHPVFAITYDPRMPSISGIVKKDYRTLVKDPHFAEAFPLLPLIYRLGMK